MSTIQEKAKIVRLVHECGSIAKAQRRFVLEQNKPAPHRHSIRRWVKQFEETGSVTKKKSSGRPRRSVERAKIIREAFHNCSKMSIRTASLELNIPKSSIHRILREELRYSNANVMPGKTKEGTKENKSETEKQKRLVSNDQVTAATSFNFICTVCMCFMPDVGTYREHFESQHPNTPLPEELIDPDAPPDVSPPPVLN